MCCSREKHLELTRLSIIPITSRSVQALMNGARVTEYKSVNGLQITVCLEPIDPENPEAGFRGSVRIFYKHRKVFEAAYVSDHVLVSDKVDVTVHEVGEWERRLIAD